MRSARLGDGRLGHGWRRRASAPRLGYPLPTRRRCAPGRSRTGPPLGSSTTCRHRQDGTPAPPADPGPGGASTTITAIAHRGTPRSGPGRRPAAPGATEPRPRPRPRAGRPPGVSGPGGRCWSRWPSSWSGPGPTGGWTRTPSSTSGSSTTCWPGTARSSTWGSGWRSTPTRCGCSPSPPCTASRRGRRSSGPRWCSAWRARPGAFVAGGAAVARLGARHDEGTVLPIGLLMVSVVAGVWEFATSGLEMSMVFLWLGGTFLLLVRAADRRTRRAGRRRRGRARHAGPPRAGPGVRGLRRGV